MRRYPRSESRRGGPPRLKHAAVDHPRASALPPLNQAGSFCHRPAAKAAPLLSWAERVPHLLLDTGVQPGAAERRHRLAHGEPAVGFGQPTRAVSPGRGGIRQFFGQEPTAGRHRELA